jgi:ketosteroid isomerase-like protein
MTSRGGTDMQGRDAVAAAVSGLVDAVNRSDFAAACDFFGDAAVIVEDIAPFRWEGPGAASAWLQAMGENAARLGIGAIAMTLGPCIRIEVDSGAAYALFPGQLKLSQTDADFLSDGMLTFTLKETAGRWLIDTLAWSGPEPAPR